MDIAALSMNLAQTNLLNDVGTAVLSKSLEQAQEPEVPLHRCWMLLHGAFCIS